ncbi:ATP-binding protein [Streptomyces sp. NPDC048604]|uniref:ATP-binding protein n=1 Tax=Streptomyces sp. NPDC048604 TaxID=3365578 RepID=UPI003710F368
MDAIATVPPPNTGLKEPTTAPLVTLLPLLHHRGVPTAERPGTWVLPHCPRSVRIARHTVRAALRRRGADDDTVDRAELVVSELVTNAVRHARPPLALRLHHLDDATLRIEVDDGGPTEREGARTVGSDPEEHGRGIAIIALIASAHGSHRRPAGTTYWAELSAAEAPLT